MARGWPHRLPRPGRLERRMAGFLKKVFSFGKKEVVERPAEDEALAPINWDALKEFKREETAAPVVRVEPVADLPAAPVPDQAPLAPLDGGGGERSGPKDGGISREVAAPPPVLRTTSPVEEEEGSKPPAPELPAESPTEPDLPVEVPAEPVPPARPEPEIPPAAEPEAPPAPEPEMPKDAPIEVPPAPEPPAEPDIPDEVPAEPLVPARPEPEIPPAPEPEKPNTVPDEVPPPPKPPVEPELPAEVPVEPEIPAKPEPPVEPARPIEIPAPVQPEEIPQKRPVPEVPIEVPEPARPVEIPQAQQTVLPPPSLQAVSVKTDSDDLGQIDWEGLKAFRRQDEPAPAEPTAKVTVAKKVEQKKAPTPPPTPEPKLTWYQRLRQGLARSSRELSGNIAGIFTKRKLDEETLQDLEDVLIRADLGVETAMRVTDTLASSRYGKEISDHEVRAVMASEVEKVLTPVAQALELDLTHKPHVILVVGVNGTGKTTTIGKLAAKLKDGGLSVMLAAGDTFRAAAIEQLKIWGERTGSPVVSSKLGADAAGLAFDAFVQAKEAGSDVLIIDTAGRLQNKTELMAELEKIVRVLGKHDPEAPHTVLQTVDATTGQNALNQVEIFRNVAGVNGLVMTKLDGTARGGILVAIAAKYKLPVYFIGVGEQVDDLEPFSAGDFAKAIAGVG